MLGICFLLQFMLTNSGEREVKHADSECRTRLGGRGGAGDCKKKKRRDLVKFPIFD